MFQCIFECIFEHMVSVYFSSLSVEVIKHKKKIIPNTAQKIHQGNRNYTSMFAFLPSSFPTTHYKLTWRYSTSKRYISSLLRKDTSISLLILKAKCCADRLRTTFIWHKHQGNNSSSLLSFKGSWAGSSPGQLCRNSLFLLPSLHYGAHTAF